MEGHLSWQEQRERERRARAKEYARRRAQPLAKLIRPDGSWCWVRAYSKLDAVELAERHGFQCPPGTGFWHGDTPTAPEKEYRLR